MIWLKNRTKRTANQNVHERVKVSVVDRDLYSGASWIRIRNTHPDPHMQIYIKMEAKDVRFKKLINSSETQLIKKIVGDSLFL